MLIGSLNTAKYWMYAIPIPEELKANKL